MRITQQSQSRWHLTPGRTLLALALALAVLGTLAGVSLLTAHAQQQKRLAPATGCSTCPHYHYFIQTATAANSASDYTILDSPYTNGQPGDILMVTQLAYGFFTDHNLGVWYAPYLGKWTIFYQDGVSITAGTQFNVNVVTPGSKGDTGSTAFVQQAASGNTVGDSTVLYNSNTDNQPNAVIIVTPVYGATGQYENHPIGVWYTGSHWAIFNEDLAPMAPGELFDVVIAPAATAYEPTVGPANWAGTFTTTASNTSGASALLNSSGVQYDLYWVTPNWGTAGELNNHPTGVWYNPASPYYQGPWYVINEDLAPMPLGLTFNVEGITH
jgi:hypothetical protein